MNFFPGISTRQDCADEFGENHRPFQTLIPVHRLLDPSDEANRIPDLVPISGTCSNRESPEQNDYYEACLSYIHDILMEEEDVDDAGAILQDYRALQATEKSFYDALSESNSSSNQYQSSFYGQHIEFPDSEFLATRDAVESNSWVLYQGQIEPFLYMVDTQNHSLESNSRSFGSISSLDDNVGGLLADSPVSTLLAAEASSGSRFSRESSGVAANCDGSSNLVSERVGSKKIQRDGNGDCQDLRSNKHLASCNEDDCEEIQHYDDILLPKNEKDDVSPCKDQLNSNSAQNENQNTKRSRGRKSRAKKRGGGVEVVDLRTLLTHCAQAVASFDLKTANDLLRQIREHSSPYGDCIQRVAHYFANGLEARMAGTGSQLYFHFINSRVPPSGVLKAYQCYASAVPIFRTSFYLANQMIARLAENATQIHVIDFGIYHGFQWPSLIQHLSERPTGPPKLRITGIDFPLNGFRPAEKVEQTGRRLKAYCERFKVPFEYNAIAQTWETIQPEDIKIERGELVMVNCQYRSTTLLDETVEVNCPRDAFLRLIRNLNPDLFIHGIINGTYGAPFFITRFREALFNFISMFDIYEATMRREDHERLLIEQNLHGTEILNTVASEGIERVARPEPYKQWQIRMLRAGFVQQPIYRGIIDRSKDIVKEKYHKDFVVDVDGHWMLQGWKGRILFAISCWKPAETTNQ